MLTDPYLLPLTKLQAAHLLRRATFGPSPAQIKAFTGLTAASAVQQLLASQTTPAPPLDPATGQRFDNLPHAGAQQGSLNVYVQGWWAGIMLNQPVSLLEKMTLFWSNHFVTNFSTVNDYRFMYQYNTLLRQYALGNVKAFAIAITQNPAMLRFLNGNDNVAGTPNENYGRELQELFTVGRNGGYTEDDVRTAARVLTGWTDFGYRAQNSAAFGSQFQAAQHDTGDKTFSSAYKNTTIKGQSGSSAGLTELGQLIDMIMANPEAPRYVCRQLYRFFINYDITPDVEANFIQPLADLFRATNFELKPVMTTLLNSSHFFDAALTGAVVKPPTDLVLGTLRFFSITTPTDLTSFYQLVNYLFARIREQQQELLDPPTVFGWTAYYQTGYYQQWINSSTLGLRGYFTDTLTNGNIKVGGKSIFDPLSLVKNLTTPSDPLNLVSELVAYLIPVSYSAAQLDFLTDTVLLGGLPRYEWTGEWAAYVASPTDATKAKIVTTRLTGFLGYLFRTADYQLM